MKKRDILSLLPQVFRSTWEEKSLLDRVLESMKAMLDPVEAILERFDEQLDPRSARDDFARTLARWVHPDFSLNLPLGRLRELTAEAGALARLRGTEQGLTRFLEIATGISGFEIKHDIPSRPFHMVVKIPPAALEQSDLIHQLVLREKPAYLTCTIATKE